MIKSRTEGWPSLDELPDLQPLQLETVEFRPASKKSYRKPNWRSDEIDTTTWLFYHGSKGGNLNHHEGFSVDENWAIRTTQMPDGTTLVHWHDSGAADGIGDSTLILVQQDDGDGYMTLAQHLMQSDTDWSLMEVKVGGYEFFVGRVFVPNTVHWNMLAEGYQWEDGKMVHKCTLEFTQEWELVTDIAKLTEWLQGKLGALVPAGESENVA